MKKIAIFLPSRSQDVLNDLKTVGTGAREQIAYWLANQLAPKNEVHVFANMPESKHFPNLHWVPQEMASVMLQAYEWDALVSFDFPSVASLPDIKSTVKRLVVAQNYFEIPPEGFTPDVFDLVDSWVFPSQWALENCSRVNETPVDRGHVINYAVDPELYKGNWSPHEGPLRFIYANQAESGLAQTLRMWPEILKALPDSELVIATPVDEFVEQIQWSHSIQSELALDIRDLITQENVMYFGRQNPPTLAKLFYDSDFLLFPAEPISPSEIGSLPMLQAASAGCAPIFNRVDALEELYGGAGEAVLQDHFLETVIEAASKPDYYRDMAYSVANDGVRQKVSLAEWKSVLGAD